MITYLQKQLWKLYYSLKSLVMLENNRFLLYYSFAMVCIMKFICFTSAQTASSTIFSSIAYSPSQNSAAVSSPANPTTIVSSPVVISSSILTPSVQSSPNVIPTALHSIVVQPSLGAISVQVSKLLQPTQLQGLSWIWLHWINCNT